MTWEFAATYAATKSWQQRAMARHVLAENKSWDVWGEHGWNVALDRADDVERAVGYVEGHPLKEAKKPQVWDFVTAFDERVARHVRFGGKTRAIGGAALRSRLLKIEREGRARRERRG